MKLKDIPTYHVQPVEILRYKLLNIRGTPGGIGGLLKYKRVGATYNPESFFSAQQPEPFENPPGLSFFGVNGAAFTAFGDMALVRICLPRPLFARDDGVNEGESTLRRFLALSSDGSQSSCQASIMNGERRTSLAASEAFALEPC